MNGWKNRETWNVALWLDNDESLYRYSRLFRSYSDFARTVKGQRTPDGVSYNSRKLDRRSLTALIKDNQDRGAYKPVKVNTSQERIGK